MKDKEAGVHYFKFNHPTRGLRYFKVVEGQDTVVQALVLPGETKKGRPNMIGIYQMARISMVSNYDYMLDIHLKRCTRREWDAVVKKVFSQLK